MALTVSVINYKGGVGKTTLAANLGCYLAGHGKRVLIVDLDPQGSLTFSFVTQDEWKDELKDRKTVRLWFDSYIYDSRPPKFAELIIQPPAVANRLAAPVDSGHPQGALHLLASDLGLINVELELAPKLSSGTMSQAAHNFVKVHSLLKEGLAQLPPTAYEFVLIDCPPNFSIVTKNALVASHYYLVPARPDYLSTVGLDELERHVRQLVEQYNQYVAQIRTRVAHLVEGHWDPIDPVLLGVVFTMVQFYAERPIRAQEQYIQQVRGKGVPVFETMVRDNKSLFAMAPEWGVPVVLAQSHGSSQEQVRSELENLAVEFVRWVETREASNRAR